MGCSTARLFKGVPEVIDGDLPFQWKPRLAEYRFPSHSVLSDVNLQGRAEGPPREPAPELNIQKLIASLVAQAIAVAKTEE